jgi:hypothetical protein
VLLSELISILSEKMATVGNSVVHVLDLHTGLTAELQTVAGEGDASKVFLDFTNPAAEAPPKGVAKREE